MKPVRWLATSLVLLAIGLQFFPAGGAWPVAAVAVCDAAEFIADVTVPDGTSFAPGAAISKTWRLKNVGTCTWTTDYAVVFVSGAQMGAPAVVNLPAAVAPGAMIDITVNMTAPTAPGTYTGYWKLRNAGGVLFGVGAGGNNPFIIKITVPGSVSTAYDFVANYCSAAWMSGAGALPCPGTDGDANGYVLKVDAPLLETGVTDTVPGLVVAPQNVNNGFISGVYPAFTVQRGDRFQATLSCAHGVATCYVTFRLDYQIGSGPVRTFWSFQEKTEGKVYRANVDLSSLAGQSVKFILTVSATGSPTGDRATWGGARIVRGSGTSPTPTPAAGTTCDKATFLADVTIPDGTTLTAGTAFTKTWRIRNDGSCTWTTSYALVFSGGDLLGATPTVPLPTSVAPGQTVEVSVNMVAPTMAGHYRSYWMLRNAAGRRFGFGPSGAAGIFADINVSGGYTTVYDFYANACSATWTSGAGVLPCPGTDGDAKGFVLKLDAPRLEDNTTGAPGLLTFPQRVTNGYIQGIYPPYTVQNGDRFQSIVNCQRGSTGCYVKFRLDYQIGSGPVQTLKTFSEKLDGMYYRFDVDLSSLAGQNVKFILTVLASGSASGDRAIWSGPRIARPPSP
ncbi:MAG: NBR1-Ig-like domain-containing protein [Anaerolineales bacterium]|nr:NBR1-Ig-like domain-containing protein [Anaerolineales bacterium]MDW8227826.1 NBR1-Ig-like domain-containing protein [Anaerolineales bacterium]